VLFISLFCYFRSFFRTPEEVYSANFWSFAVFQSFFSLASPLGIFLLTPLDMRAINCANDAGKVRLSVKLLFHFQYVGVFWHFDELFLVGNKAI